MRSSYRLSVLSLGVALAVGLAALPASAGVDPPIVKVARHRWGPYKEFFIKLKMDPDDSKDFFLKARNAEDATGPQPATLVRLVGPSDCKAKYFKGNQNITQEVNEGGYDFTLTDDFKRFRGIVKDGGEAPTPDCINLRLAIEGAFHDNLVGINGNCI